MANVQYYDVILKPVVTEKSMELMGRKEIHFLYTQKQQNLRLKKLLKKCLQEQKEKVNTMNNDGKKKKSSWNLQFGKTAKTKKAIVKLRTEDSADIEIFQGL